MRLERDSLILVGDVLWNPHEYMRPFTHLLYVSWSDTSTAPQFLVAVSGLEVLCVAWEIPPLGKHTMKDMHKT